jgi:signal transduction histidine kinase
MVAVVITMNPFSRLFSVSAVLLVLLLTVALAAQGWLRRETHRLAGEAVDAQRRVFSQAVALGRRPPAQWDSAYLHSLGTLVGGKIELHPPGTAPDAIPALPDSLAFDHAIPGAPGWTARVTVERPALTALLALHQRTLVGIVLMALVLTAVPLVLSLLWPRRESLPAAASALPWKAAKADAVGLEHFARMSLERGAALERESGARRRAEENLQLSHVMLDRSHEERARLGRDLHDNICQTLYAVSLTLESVRKKMTATPEVEHRLEHGIAELRRLNQEVRAYIRELGPDEIQRHTFVEAVDHMLRGVAADAGVSVAQQFDEEAVALIRPQQAPDVVNILREAVSNAVRHGQARHLTLRAERGDNVVALAVQDDGAGFTPPGDAAGGGHGLANMQTRAEALGGSLRIDSAPGKGTRVLLTVPVVSEA